MNSLDKGKTPEKSSPSPSNSSLTTAEENEIMASVPRFLRKTFQILSNSEYAEICCFTKCGKVLEILDIQRFVKEVLPVHFKHNNLSSFIRQLNMYDFHKVSTDKKSNAFKHPQFQKDRADLLKNIKRKQTVTEVYKNQRLKSDGLLDELQSIRQKSEMVEARMKLIEDEAREMRSENLLLWNQLLASRSNQSKIKLRMKSVMSVVNELCLQQTGSSSAKLKQIKSGLYSMTDEDNFGSKNLPMNSNNRSILRYLSANDSDEGFNSMNAVDRPAIENSSNSLKRKHHLVESGSEPRRSHPNLDKETDSNFPPEYPKGGPSGNKSGSDANLDYEEKALLQKLVDFEAELFDNLCS